MGITKINNLIPILIASICVSLMFYSLYITLLDKAISPQPCMCDMGSGDSFLIFLNIKLDKLLNFKLIGSD